MEGSTKHTVIIGDVQAMWEKMYWDIETFSDIQRSYPEEIQPLVYAALNACISAWSLEKWVEKAWKKKLRLLKQSPSYDFRCFISEKIPAQNMCADIANTTKHAEHREERWKFGALTLKREEGDEYSPPGLVLIKTDGNNSTLFYNELFDLPKEWWDVLLELGLVTESQPTPEWLRRKLHRIFGEV